MSASMAFLGGSSWSGNTLDRRDAKRYDLLRSATAFCRDTRQPGVVRDLSEDGLFMYIDFMPQVGEQLHVIVEGSPRSIRVTGTVLRVECDFARDNFGIALRINSSFLLQPFVEDVFQSLAA